MRLCPSLRIFAGVAERHLLQSDGHGYVAHVPITATSPMRLYINLIKFSGSHAHTHKNVEEEGDEMERGRPVSGRRVRRGTYKVMGSNYDQNTSFACMRLS